MSERQFYQCSNLDYKPTVDKRSLTKTTNIYFTPASDTPELTHLKAQLAEISKNVPATSNPLKPLIEQIALLFNPAKVYKREIISTTNTAIDSYTQLIIIVSDTGQCFSEIRPALDIAMLQHIRVCYSLHSLGSVTDCLKKGHIFLSLHCTEKNLVFDDGKTKLPPISTEDMDKLKATVMATFMTGFNKAYSFYQFALQAKEENQLSFSLFFLHQTIEFVYRAILQNLNGYDKPTHSIRMLKNHVKRCTPQLMDIFPDDTMEEKRIMDILEGSYTKTRYENGYTVTETNLQLVFTRARQLLVRAKGALEDALSVL